MVIPLQLGFADYDQTFAKKKTRRQIFLEQIELPPFLRTVVQEACSLIILLFSARFS